jgi:hypothetical protein
VIHHLSDHILISFDSRQNEVDAFYELLLNRMSVKSAGPNKYIVKKVGLDLLDSKGIKYILI